MHVRYHVDLGSRAQHLVTVTVTPPASCPAGARMLLPAWTPGSYVLRHYSRYVQQVTYADGERLRRDGTGAWLIDRPDPIRVELYANQPTVRTNHVTADHALLVGPATFPLIEPLREVGCEVTVALPAGWRAWGLLPRSEAGWWADGYDHLADSAVVAGADLREVRWEVQGVPHRLVWAGAAGRPDLDRLAAAAARVGEAAATLFGALPMTEYTFVLLAWDEGGGGLEHRDGAVLQVPVRTFGDPAAERRLVELVAHEYLHAWNVKRLIPAELVRLDYERPVRTTALWIAEGWTSYYDDLLLVRTGLWSPRQYLDHVAGRWEQARRTPGAALRSVEEASFDAWTHHYLRDEHTDNATPDYYTHGAVLAWTLDLMLRRLRPDGDGLDDVLRLLWQRFADTGQGYTAEDVRAAAAEVAGADLDAFFDAHVSGTIPPPVEELLEVVGLRVEDTSDADDPPPPELGVVTGPADGGVAIRTVWRGGPAWRAGVTGGDVLLAVDRTLVADEGALRALLRTYPPGAAVELALRRGPRLELVVVELGAPQPRLRLVPVPSPTDAQRAAFQRWTGADLDSVAEVSR